jgi:hypothetical protein
MKKYYFLALLFSASPISAQTYTPEQQRQQMEYMTATVPASLACTCSAYVQAQVTNSESLKGTRDYDDLTRASKWLMGFCAKSISKQLPGQEAKWSSKMLDIYQDSLKSNRADLDKKITQCENKMDSYIPKGK